MNPKEQNLLKTLNLLVMMSRARQHFPPNLSGEEKATLTISKQILDDSGLTVPEFTNCLQDISKKGYFWHFVVFDEHIRNQVDEYINSELYAASLEKIKELDTKENSDKLKQAAITDLNRIAPHGVTIDPKDVADEFIKFSDVLNEGIQVFKKMRPDELALILLMPFRNIETLFNRMNKGDKFDDIQDDGFWYDKDKFEFHIDEKVIQIRYQGKPNLEHTILSEFFSKPSISKIEYEEISGFDISKGNGAYRDAMRKFTKKHPKLKLMFSVHEYHTEFYPDRYNQIP
jgi:hypothetical protein